MKLPVILLCGNAGVGKDTVGQMIVDRWGFTKFSQADTIKEIAKDVFGFTDDQLWGPSEFRNAIDYRFGRDSLMAAKLRAAAADNFVDHPMGAPLHGSRFIQEVWYPVFTKRTGELGNLTRLGVLLRSFCGALHAFIEKENGLTPRIVLQLLGTEVGRAFRQDIWVQGALQKAEAALLNGAAGVVVCDGRFRNEILGFRRFGGYAIKINGDTSLPADAHPSEVEVTKIPEQFYDAVLQNNKLAGLDGLRYAVGEMLRGLLSPPTTLTY